MKRATAVVRHYTAPDATMRQNLRTMHGHYLTNEAAFQAFNPEFDAGYGKHWLAAIDAADAAPTSSVRVGELKEDTAAVNDMMTQAQAAVQTLFYFVGRAFPHNAGRLDQYGRRDYVAARDNHDKMRTLLATALASATRDKGVLAARGYTAAQLEALTKLEDQLTTTNTTQEVKKGQNTEGTDDYLTAQNLAYGYGQEVSAAAKILFASEAATLALFRLTTPAPQGPEHHELTLAEGAAGPLLFSTPMLATTQLRLHLAAALPEQAATVGRLPAGSPPPPPLLAYLTPEAADLHTTAEALGPVGQVLWVANTGKGPVRVEATLLSGD